MVTLDETPYACVLGSRGDPAALSVAGPGLPRAIHMDGPAVFRFAVEALPRCARTLLDQAG